MGKHYSTKHYGHNIGLSAVFRQPNADHSHCHFLHGYSLAFTFTFGCDELDNKNWAVDFGGLKPLKAWLEDSFDHKLCLDKDDPHLEKFRELEALDLADIRIFDGVGAEMFVFSSFFLFFQISILSSPLTGKINKIINKPKRKLKLFNFICNINFVIFLRARKINFFN